MKDLTHLLSDSQAALLEVIKREGECTVEKAVDSVELATTTVRQHLDRLEELDLVERSSRAEGPGRPRLYYRLSRRGHALYPSQDGQVLSALLEHLAQRGHHRSIDSFFRDYWDERHEAFQRRLEEQGLDSLEERLQALEEFLDEQGFEPRIEEGDGEFTICECHCPMRSAVEATRLPCRLEAQFLKAVVGRDLERVAYIPDGANACRYTFSGSPDLDTQAE